MVIRQLRRKCFSDGLIGRFVVIQRQQFRNLTITFEKLFHKFTKFLNRYFDAIGVRVVKTHLEKFPDLVNVFVV